MMKYIILFSLILQHCVTVQAQIKDKELAKNILEKVTANYKNKSAYDYSINYKMYKGANGTKPEKQYKGRIVKSGSSLYYEVAGTHTILSGGQYVRASHEQKLIEYSKTEKAVAMPFATNDFLRHFKEAMVQDKGAYWICTLSVGKLTSLNYNKVELIINKDYTLSKQIFYYLKKIPFKRKNSKEEFDYPRLEIIMDKNKSVKKESLFAISEYIILRNNKVIPALKYSNYNIIDLSKK
jgi:hypothetical protein